MKSKSFPLAISLIFASAALLPAQEFRGTISGAVTDPTGASAAAASAGISAARGGPKSYAGTRIDGGDSRVAVSGTGWCVRGIKRALFRPLE